MDLLEALRVALEALRANKLRSALSVVGIAIGVFAVIALVSVGQTARSSVTGEFASLGPDLLWVLPGKAKDDGRTGGVPTEEARLSLTYEDALAVEREADSVAAVTPLLQTQLPVFYGTRRTITTIMGATPSLQETRDVKVQRGRFLSDADLTGRKRVAVIGPTTARDLFGAFRNPVGRRITVGGRSYEIVGVTVAEGQILGVDPDDRVYVPLPTAQQQFNIEYASFFFVKARSTALVDRAARETRRILLRRHDEEDFTVLSQSQLLSTVNSILGILTVALSSIGAISLVVGGIGIMNIMLVSVTERTREIGIRKAVGAKKGDVLTQFLIEAVVISLLGGVIGMLLGLGASWVVSTRLLDTSLAGESTWPIVALAFGFSVLVGLVFGVYPAYRAAQLHPIEALRYE